MLVNSIYMNERPADRVEPHMERIASQLGKHLAVYIPDLCGIFVGSKSNGEQLTFAGHSVPSSFTIARLWLLDSIYHCLTDVKDDLSLLETIPEAFWSILVDSFFQFRFNNAFHVHFYKFFRAVLYSEQAAVHDRFFIKTNFITRLIEHYRARDQPTGSRGYIILILNCIRLSAEVEAQRLAAAADKTDDDDKSSVSGSELLLRKEGLISTKFWTDQIRANSEWESFQPMLRQATLEQTSDTLYEMDPNLRFQLAPLQSRQPTEAPLTKRHTGIPAVSARGNEGIGLDGNSLGFGVPMKYDRDTDEQAKEEERAKEEKRAKEDEHKTQFEKARADLMANISGMNWKLIPPQRVLNAMLAITQGKGIAAATAAAIGNTNSTNGHASATTTNSERDDTTMDLDSGSNSNGATTKEGGTQSCSKPKKKKRNKKKRRAGGGGGSGATVDDGSASAGTGSGADACAADDDDDDDDDDKNGHAVKEEDNVCDSQGDHQDDNSSSMDEDSPLDHH
ncbi:hypothetical protein BGZ65_010025, partial [Modicella reniformis]